jgi:hypothetical protein
MTQNQDSTNLEAMLWQFMGMDDPMRSMLEGRSTVYRTIC